MRKKPQKKKAIKQNEIRRTEKVCFNCCYMSWHVGVGQGILCGCSENKVDNFAFRIPSRWYSCKFFHQGRW